MPSPNKVQGIVAYNKIRSQLSKQVKSEGIELEKGGFNKLSRDIFRHNKGKQLNPVIRNIGDQIIAEREPDIGVFDLYSDLLKGFYYYEFKERYIPSNMHEDLWIVSDYLEESVKAEELDYSKHIAPLVSFIDKNRTHDKAPNPKFWFYDYAVILKFTKPKFNPKTMRYESILYASKIYSEKDTDRIPYDPEMKGYYAPEELEQILPELGKPAIPEEEIEEKPEDVKRKEEAESRKFRIQEIEKETELQKEKRKYVEAKERLVDKYTNLYKEGIITKSELKKKIKEI